MSTSGPVEHPYQFTPETLWKRFGASMLASSAELSGRRARIRRAVGLPLRGWSSLAGWFSGWLDKEQRTAKVAKRLAATTWAGKRYADAWVLMDRRGQAQDNAEHLYAYLQNKRPAVNAWFVLDRESADWSRLRRRGFKLVGYGSLRWRVLLLSARHLISSHCDVAITNPLPVRLYGKPGFKFTFLQHGVTKDDISRWLNTKNIDLMLTVTEPEANSLAGEGTPYTLTSKEVRRTGFPRHDRLVKLSRGTKRSKIDQILVMPTWRHSLTSALPAGLAPEERLSIFCSSVYAERWLTFLGSAELAEVAARTGARLTLLPHPHDGMAELMRSAGVPEHVRVLDWKDIDFQEELVRSRAFITDYTSAAFDAAMLRTPILYYQFDRDQFFGGGHQWRRGYFDYDRDGFGPVARTQEELLASLEKLAADGFTPAPEYARRMDETFGEHAGNSCYQVYKAITQLDKPVRARPLGGGETDGAFPVQSPDEARFDQETDEDALAAGLLAEGGQAGDLVFEEQAVDGDARSEHALISVGASAGSEGDTDR